MFVRLSMKALAVIIMITSVCLVFGKYSSQAKKNLPSDENSVLYTKFDDSYRSQKHLDANFDGEITLRELHNFNKFYKAQYNSKDARGFEFVLKLSNSDRMLLNGLTLEVAQLAHHMLTPDEKLQLVELKSQERINLINHRFEPLLNSKNG